MFHVLKNPTKIIQSFLSPNRNCLGRENTALLAALQINYTIIFSICLKSFIIILFIIGLERTFDAGSNHYITFLSLTNDELVK